MVICTSAYPHIIFWRVYCTFRVVKPFLVLLFLFVSGTAVAQKSYLVHLTIDKVILGKDSVVFKNGKTFLLETKGRTDTLEVAKVGGVPVAIVVDIRKVMAGSQVKNQVGYAFFKKTGGKWELIRHFGYTDRYDIIAPRPGFEASAKKKPAREEYFCTIGDPVQFYAKFRMDVYEK
jgi:hypothetical protein